jgi:hypothetical protein
MKKWRHLEELFVACWFYNCVSHLNTPPPVLIIHRWPPLWSIGQSSRLQIQRSVLYSRRYQILRQVVGLERSPLSLVSTIEELLGRNISGSSLESLKYGRSGPSRWPNGTLYPQKLALTSSTSGCRSVRIVRSRTQATDCSLVSFSFIIRGLLWVMCAPRDVWNCAPVEGVCPLMTLTTHTSPPKAFGSVHTCLPPVCETTDVRHRSDCTRLSDRKPFVCWRHSRECCAVHQMSVGRVWCSVLCTGLLVFCRTDRTDSNASLKIDTVSIVIAWLTARMCKYCTLRYV